MDAEPEDPLERRRDELRRIVYGTPGEPPEDVVAELAAVERELAARDEPVDVAASDSLDRGTPDEPAPRPGTADDEDGTDDSDAATSVTERLQQVRRRPLTIAIVATVLLGAALALISPVRELLSPPRGLAIFERPANAEEQVRADRVAAGAGLESDVAASLRSVGRVFGYDFWVMQEGRQVCLISQREFWFDWVADCVQIDEFGESELTRRISGDDIRDEDRPPRIRPEDTVLVSWGPRSTEVEWEVVPPS